MGEEKEVGDGAAEKYGTESGGTYTPRWERPPRLTNVTALAVLVAWQASVGGVVAADHSSVVVDDGIQVVDGGLLHLFLILLADTELT